METIVGGKNTAKHIWAITFSVVAKDKFGVVGLYDVVNHKFYENAGGGVFNQFIMERLTNKLPCIVEKEKNYESLEAFSFAILGYYTLQGVATNVPSVTGASKPCILGNITNPIIRGEI